MIDGFFAFISTGKPRVDSLIRSSVVVATIMWVVLFTISSIANSAYVGVQVVNQLSTAAVGTATVAYHKVTAKEEGSVVESSTFDAALKSAQDAADSIVSLISPAPDAVVKEVSGSEVPLADPVITE